MKEPVKSIRHCSNTELNLRLLTLVQKEREMLTEIILHIQEISRRKVYLEMGYPSMFAYMTEHLKYSPGSAIRRLDAAKVAKEAPEVLNDLQTGSLNLSQVSMLEQSVRQIEKTTPQRSIDRSEKLELLRNLSGKTKSQSEVLIHQALGFRPQKETRTQHQADESVTMTLNLSKQEWAEIEQMRELLSNATGGGLKETLVHAARLVIKQKTHVKPKATTIRGKDLNLKVNSTDSVTALINPKTPLANPATSGKNAQKNSVAEFTTSQRPSVSLSTRKQIWWQYQSCQYRDPNSGKLCGSRHFMTTEHKHPVWAGGTNAIQNLTLLCAAHNVFQYKKQARLL